MMGWHNATGIGRKPPALAVHIADCGCFYRSPIDSDMIGDFDILPGKSHDGLDQRRKPAIAQSPAKITAPSCLLERGRHRWADEDEISRLDRAMKGLDPPQPERLARRQVQTVTAEPGDSCKTEDGATRRCQRQNNAPPPPHCFITGVWRWIR